MNLSFSMFPNFYLSRRNEMWSLFLPQFNLDQTAFCRNEFVYRNLSVKSYTRSLAHESIKCSYWDGAVRLYYAAMRNSLKNCSCTRPIVCNIWLKVDLVWSNCRRFTYHKEMNTTNMTFAAPSLQLRLNTFFHSYWIRIQRASFKQVFEIILSNWNFF